MANLNKVKQVGLVSLRCACQVLLPGLLLVFLFVRVVGKTLFIPDARDKDLLPSQPYLRTTGMRGGRVGAYAERAADEPLIALLLVLVLSQKARTQCTARAA